MKSRYLLIALVLGMGLGMILLRLLGGSGAGLSVARANAYTVCPAGPTDCDYSTVQAAVEAASDGDVIKVATGLYTDVHGRPVPPGYDGSGIITQVVFITRSVTIRGGYTAPYFADPPDPQANPTTLDAGGKGRVILIAGNISATIEGLHITGGDAYGLCGWGGDCQTDPIHAGGGVYVVSATITLSDNIISSNSIDKMGMGNGLFTWHSEGSLIGNTIISNTGAGWGGGLALAGSDVSIRDNVISKNSGRYGGGLWLCWSSRVSISQNIITGNVAGEGGGLYQCLSPEVTIINSIIADNRAHVAGSGLFFAYNSGSRLLHTTIARNRGGGAGVHLDSGTIAVTNTILMSHTVGISVSNGSTLTVNGVLWHNNPITISHSSGAEVTVGKQVVGDPTFATDGYHLMPGSAAIDNGVNTTVATDIDGHSRPLGGGYDIGADEFLILPIKTYLPLIVR